MDEAELAALQGRRTTRTPTSLYGIDHTTPEGAAELRERTLRRQAQQRERRANERAADATDGTIGVTDAAAILGVTAPTIANWTQRGRLTPIINAAGKRRYTIEDVRGFYVREAERANAAAAEARVRAEQIQRDIEARAEAAVARALGIAARNRDQEDGEAAGGAGGAGGVWRLTGDARDVARCEALTPYWNAYVRSVRDELAAREARVWEEIPRRTPPPLPAVSADAHKELVRASSDVGRPGVEEWARGVWEDRMDALAEIDEAQRKDIGAVFTLVRVEIGVGGIRPPKLTQHWLDTGRLHPATWQEMRAKRLEARKQRRMAREARTLAQAATEAVLGASGALRAAQGAWAGNLAA